jgi:hypothetical protein
MDDYLFPSISKITSTIQGIKHGGLTLQASGRRIVEDHREGILCL